MKRARYAEKAEVLRAVETRGNRTTAEVAESLGVPEQRIHDWKRAERDSGTKSNDRGETIEQEVRRLRGELAEVKKDRDVLVQSIAALVKERNSRHRALTPARGADDPLLLPRG